jgi:ABC-type transport system involved in multi-copper enzyme maturation permease subunit
MPAYVVLSTIVLPVGIVHWRVVRRGGWQLIGPHSYYDLIRMARKGRTALFRVLFLGALLVGISYAYETHRAGQRGFRFARGFDETGAGMRDELARLNIACVHVWFLLQNATILLLTPAYMGGAIAEERERGTLDMLLATQLSSREIVLGKLVARLVHLGAFLLAGLPVFSIMLVWGGIDLRLLLANWINSVLLLLAAGSMCIMFSTMQLRPTTCILTSYAIVLPGGACCTSGMQSALQELLLGTAGGGGSEGLFLLSVVYGVTILGCLFIAIQAMHPVGGLAWYTATPWHIAAQTGPIAVPLSAEAPAPLRSTVATAAAAATPDAVWWQRELPPITEDALAWKERNTGGRSLLHQPEIWVLGVTVGGWLFVLWLAHLGSRIAASNSIAQALSSLARDWGPVLRVAYAICLLCFLLGATIRAAGSVVRERQMHTLDMLLTIPIARSEILRAKWWGAILKGWPWLALAAVAVLVGAAIGAFHPLAALLLLVFPCPLVSFLVTAGILISTVAHTPVQANLGMAGFLLAGAALIAATHPGLFFAHSTLTFSWWNAATELSDMRALEMDVCAASAASVLLLLAGALAWTVAILQFDRTAR